MSKSAMGFRSSETKQYKKVTFINRENSLDKENLEDELTVLASSKNSKKFKRVIISDSTTNRLDNDGAESFSNKQEVNSSSNILEPLFPTYNAHKSHKK